MPQEPEVNEQFKEMLIDQYVSQNPGIARSQVVTRLQNGKLVCDTIDKVFQETSAKRAKQEEKELLKKHLVVKDDERYQECLHSIQGCKRVINFLFTSRYCNFGLNEKNENLRFLRRNERIAVDRAHTLHELKKDFLQMMGGNINPTNARTRDHVTRYFQAVVEQLKAQHAIYKREFDLGSNFTDFARSFFEEHVPAVKAKLDVKIRKHVTQAYRLAKGETGNAPDLEEVDRDILEAALAEMGDKLDKRRIQFQAIEKVVAYLESLVRELEKSGTKQAPAPKKEKSGKDDGKRMAFASKVLGGLFKGRKKK